MTKSLGIESIQQASRHFFSFCGATLFSGIRFAYVRAILIAVFTSLILGACSKAPSKPRILKLNFAPYFGDKALNCQLQFEAQNQQWQAQALGIFISDVVITANQQTSKQQTSNTRLYKNDWQTSESALLWFTAQASTNEGQGALPNVNIADCQESVENSIQTNNKSNSSLLIELPAGIKIANDMPEFSIGFTMGLPFEINHANPLLQASPINIPDMFWSWRNGHKFLRLDLVNDNNSSTWSLHLGSVGCSSASSLRAPQNPCQQANRFYYSLELNPNLINKAEQTNTIDEAGTQIYEQSVKLDLAPIIKGITLSQSQSCMFDYSQQNQCAQIIDNLKNGRLFEVTND